MKHRLFFVLGCAFLVALPVSVLLPGCGGGNSDVGSGSFTSTVTLSPSQVGYLSLTTGGTVANGFLRVASSNAADTGDKTTRAFNFAVANGSYGFTGLFSPPNGFSVSGNFGNLPFTIVGQIPTNSGNGNYTITVGGQTVNGNLLTGNFTPTPGGTATGTPSGTATGTPMGTPIPGKTSTSTPTPKPTATRTPTPTATPTTPVTANNSVSNIVFSSVAGVNATSTAPYSATLPSNGFFKNSGSSFQGTAFFETKVGSVTRKLTFEGPINSAAVSAGKSFPVGGGEGQELANIYYSEVGSSGVEKSWEAKSGSYLVVSGDSNKVSFSLNAVKFGPSFNANGATGTFTLNGRGSVGK